MNNSSYDLSAGREIDHDDDRHHASEARAQFSTDASEASASPALGKTERLESYTKAKRLNPTSIVFYQVGDHFDAYGPDAHAAAAVLKLTLSHHGRAPKGGVARLRLKGSDAELHFARLFRAGLRTSTYEKDPRESNAPRDTVAALAEGIARPGFAWLDRNTRVLKVCEVGKLDDLPMQIEHFIEPTCLMVKTLPGTPFGGVLDDWADELQAVPIERFDVEAGRRRILDLFGDAPFTGRPSLSDQQVAAVGAILADEQNTRALTVLQIAECNGMEIAEFERLEPADEDEQMSSLEWWLLPDPKLDSLGDIWHRANVERLVRRVEKGKMDRADAELAIGLAFARHLWRHLRDMDLRDSPEWDFEEVLKPVIALGRWSGVERGFFLGLGHLIAWGHTPSKEELSPSDMDEIRSAEIDNWSNLPFGADAACWQPFNHDSYNEDAGMYEVTGMQRLALRLLGENHAMRLWSHLKQYRSDAGARLAQIAEGMVRRRAVNSTVSGFLWTLGELIGTDRVEFALGDYGMMVTRYAKDPARASQNG